MSLHRGRIGEPAPLPEEVRPLTREDLELIKQERKADPVANLKDSHHRVARLTAMGLRPQEVAERTGYSYARVTTLRASPAFQELVAKYREDVDGAWRQQRDEFEELAMSNMLKAERQLADKLDKADENDETLPVKDLLAISRDAADRFGYGKKSTNLNVNVDFAARLEAAHARSTKVIEGRAAPLAPSSSPEPGASLPRPPERRRA